MLRIALGLSYQGTYYHGVQRLSGDRVGVANIVEQALSTVANHPVRIYPAGRTDKGVHALQQVAHFDTHAIRSEHGWLRGVNRYLPKDIRIHWVKQVPLTFHARFSAQWRRYCYLMSTTPTDAIMQHQCWHYVKELDVHSMRQVCQAIEGEYDCGAFRVSTCASNSDVRCVDWIRILENESWVAIDIQANAFLKRMVRMLVGDLLAIGSGALRPQTFMQQLTSGISTTKKQPAPAYGLYLVHIGYSPTFALPIQPAEKLWCMQLAMGNKA